MRASERWLFLADVRGSSTLSSTKATELLAALEEETARLNGVFGDELTVPLQLNYGDEIAALFHRPDRVFDALDGLRTALRGRCVLRVVIAHGPGGAESADMRKRGGLTFKAAAAAMAALKPSGRFCRWIDASPRPDSERAARLRVIEWMTEATNADVEAMTDLQFEAYRRMRAGARQVDVARDLRKSKQSVSDYVRRGRVELVLDGEELIRAELARLGSIEDN